MRNILLFILSVLMWLVMICGVLLLSSLFFWAVGSLTIIVLQINYDWTLWHGLICSLLFTIVSSMFSSNK